VNNNGQWDYASDAKPEKNTAREMIKHGAGDEQDVAGLKVELELHATPVIAGATVRSHHTAAFARAFTACGGGARSTSRPPHLAERQRQAHNRKVRRLRADADALRRDYQ
jgi:hypothetical protein